MELGQAARPGLAGTSGGKVRSGGVDGAGTTSATVARRVEASRHISRSRRCGKHTVSRLACRIKSRSNWFYQVSPVFSNVSRNGASLPSLSLGALRTLDAGDHRHSSNASFNRHLRPFRHLAVRNPLLTHRRLPDVYPSRRQPHPPPSSHWTAPQHTEQARRLAQLAGCAT